MFDHLAKFRYRADIDGLRAIAVIGVVLFHAGLGVSGGFVGVDVFFVISGFLITSLILRDLDRGSFSIVDFWERRARRIFPALVVVVIVTLIAGWFLMLPFGFQVLGQSVVALTVFASNMQFWRTSGYFDPAAEENPLLHTWSLSVEEQFYLVVPLLLLLVFTLGRQKWVGILLSVGIVVSLVGAEMWLRRDPSGSFYLLPSRAWELGAGSLLALARPLASSRWRSWLGWLGLALIFYAFFGYDAKTAFPGMAAIPPVLGTVLLIWSGMSDDEDMTFGGAHRLLASKVLVAIGLLSYSFYLWHWPFFAFHRYLFSQAPAVPLAIGYIFIALLLSALSLRYVEKPFRKGKLVTSRKHVFLFTGLVSALVLIVGLSMWKTRGMPFRLPADVVKVDAVKGDFFYQNSRVFIDEEETVVQLGKRNLSRRLLIWGDSHAGVLLAMFDAMCREGEISALSVTKGEHPPVANWSWEDPSSLLYDRMIHVADVAMTHARMLALSGELEHVVLAARWTSYMEGDTRKSGRFKHAISFSDALITTIRELESMGLKVLILLEVPCFNVHVPKAAALHYWHGWEPPYLTIEQHAKRQQIYASLIQRIQDETPNVQLVDASQSLISKKGSVDYIDKHGKLLYRDEHHLTEHGAMLLKPLFEKLLLN